MYSPYNHLLEFKFNVGIGNSISFIHLSHTFFVKSQIRLLMGPAACKFSRPWTTLVDTINAINDVLRVVSTNEEKRSSSYHRNDSIGKCLVRPRFWSPSGVDTISFFSVLSSVIRDKCPRHVLLAEYYWYGIHLTLSILISLLPHISRSLTAPNIVRKTLISTWYRTD